MPLPTIDVTHYAAQLAEKVAQFKLAFAPFALPEPEVFSSAPEHYRLRAEFRVWHQGEQLHYAMFDPDNPKQPVMVTHFPLAAEAICALMPRLLVRLQAANAGWPRATTCRPARPCVAGCSRPIFSPRSAAS